MLTDDLRECVARAMAETDGDGAFDDLRETDPEMWDAREEDREWWLRLADAAIDAQRGASEVQEAAQAKQEGGTS